MRTIGTGKVEHFLPDGSRREVEGEVEMKGDRVVVTEIIYINGQPGGAREINIPANLCVVYWKPEVYDEV
ncbi:hypothetical protein JJB07_19490 [Tumebacillus sp. ITR2]|uniref:Uncharacterized protein n=1 Tax=Tumebacillus amylolyticus TaxID=2801339 RepID=A0ABS1JFK7_9BACL|nr:hypothetical protein [Tumebacillus amylolyticus]MBL0388789.1 hypothetical protein [Tumebacillus amylolyticus]